MDMNSHQIGFASGWRAAKAQAQFLLYVAFMAGALAGVIVAAFAVSLGRL